MTEITGIVHAIRDRFASPVSGVFILVWCVINWQPLIIIGFDGTRTIPERIDYVILNYSSLTTLALIPIFATIAYVIVHPYLSAGAALIGEKAEAFRKIRSHKINEVTPYDPAEREKTEQKISQLEEALRKERTDRDAAETSLFETKRRFTEQIGKLEAHITELQQKIGTDSSSSEQNEKSNRSEDLSVLLKKLEELKSSVEEVTQRNVPYPNHLFAPEYPTGTGLLGSLTSPKSGISTVVGDDGVTIEDIRSSPAKFRIENGVLRFVDDSAIAKWLKTDVSPYTTINILTDPVGREALSKGLIESRGLGYVLTDAGKNFVKQHDTE